jgi:hypothetical protein
MFKILVILVLFITTIGFAESSTKELGTFLHCDGKEEERIEAAHSVKRMNPHRLEIHWLHGTKIFADEPPYDEDLDGVRWTYCDYKPAQKLYFLQKADKGLFTGVLLNETTGKILDAGEEIVISPNAQLFFASRQPDGMDGQEWFVFNMDGTIQWQGTSETDHYFEPSWNSKGELQAKFSCASGEAKDSWKRVTLTKSGSNWTWLPAIPCN